MTKSERKVLKDQMGPQIWTSKDMMKAFAFGMFVSALMAFPMIVNADIVHKFKNPSFSGVGTGAHYLTIENQEFQREKAIKDALDAARRAAEREAENSTLAKFIRNLESRIYAQFAKQLVDTMFSNDDPSTFGSFEMEGSVITWEIITGAEGQPDFIQLTIVDEFGSETVIRIPVGTGYYGGDVDDQGGSDDG